jgi:DNA-binding NtrC family response regulator
LHALPLIAHQAMGIGQVASLLDPDRSARRAPLVLGTNHRAVPAFGLLLAAAQAHKPADRMEIGPGLVSLPVGRSGDNGDPLTIPTDAHGALLTHDPGDGRAPQFPILSFEDIWASIEKDDPGRLRPMLEGKAVVMFPNPASPSSSEPAGMAPDTRKQQLYLLNTLLTAHWTRVPAGTWSLLISVLLAGLTAWATLRGVGWTGPAAALGIVIGYLAVVALLLYAASWIAPVAVPATAGLIALGAALAWDRFATAHRLRWLEQERRRAEEALLAVREALALRESAVDALEEDLDAARYTAAQSAGQQATLSRTIDDLRRQAEEARAQEADARAKLAEAERTVQGLQSSEPAGQRLNDGDLDRYRQDCQSLGIITQDPAVLGLFRTLKKAARSSLPILLLGQPGTGKELFARAAHRLSPRAAKPFIAVNMAAVSPELFESEIFGHRRGSFTGAVADRKGLFELAHQGTLFLDEIGDLRLDHQSKLLRVLQDKTFYRVGATAPTTVDVRIVAATNKDLRQGVAEGWFREDLYFRLQGLVLSLPPLRHRRGDIPLLAQALVRTFGTQAGRTDLSLSRDAVEALSEAPWEGNVRELAHVLEQAVALTDGPRITKADLRLPAEEPKTVGAGRAATILPDSAGDAAVLTALQAHRFDMQAAARALDWDRSTVTHRLKGLGFQALVEAEGDLGRAARALAGHPSLVRVVELKLKDYYDHLIATIQDAESPHAAIAHCRRRFKNLPDRHFKAVERLIERHFTLQQIDLPITRTPATH